MSLHISRNLLTDSWNNTVDVVEKILHADGSSAGLDCEVVFTERADSADLHVTVVKPRRNWSVTPWREPSKRSDGQFEYSAFFNLESAEQIAASIREVAAVNVVSQD